MTKLLVAKLIAFRPNNIPWPELDLIGYIKILADIN